jgi:hypothetical protein
MMQPLVLNAILEATKVSGIVRTSHVILERTRKFAVFTLHHIKISTGVKAGGYRYNR